MDLSSAQSECIGGLQTYLTGDLHGAGPGPAVVLMQGFGVPGDDLVSLWPALQVSPQMRFAFPVGRLSPPLGYPGARAWWMVDLERIVRDQSAGKGRDVREIPAGLTLAREAMLTFLDELMRKWQVALRDVVIGGFSQGAMLACDLVLRSLPDVAGLIMMSGTLIARDEWKPLMAARRGLKVYQSHGDADPLLPCRTVCELRDLLSANGIDVQWRQFHGGHEIPPVVLHDVSNFLRVCFQRRFVPLTDGH